MYRLINIVKHLNTLGWEEELQTIGVHYYSDFGRLEQVNQVLDLTEPGIHHTHMQGGIYLIDNDKAGIKYAHLVKYLKRRKAERLEDERQQAYQSHFDVLHNSINTYYASKIPDFPSCY